MIVKSEKTIKVTLIMTEKEARWLQNYMQNAFLNPGEVEGAEFKAMREDFFCTLREQIGD